MRQAELALFMIVTESDDCKLRVVCETRQVGQTKNEYKKCVTKERKESFMEKRLHGKFMKDVIEVADKS